MNKRKIIHTALAAAVALTLAGCGKKKKNQHLKHQNLQKLKRLRLDLFM